jgi:integrase
MLLSLLYTTGIRVGEALKLNFGDVFLEENLLHIRKGKFRKERYLILKPSMNKLLCSYLKQYQMIHSHHHEAPLFLGMRGKRLIYNSAQIHFKRVLRLSKLPERGWHGPRLHDLRHTFAVHRLLKWYETEQDINAKLPFLSTYMGHVKINSTQVYIHAVNELLQAGSERFHHLFLNGMNEGGAIQ